MRSFYLFVVVLLAVLPIVSAWRFQYPRNMNTQRWSSNNWGGPSVGRRLEVTWTMVFERVACLFILFAGVFVFTLVLLKAYDKLAEIFNLSRWNKLAWVSVASLTTYQIVPVFLLWLSVSENDEVIQVFGEYFHFWFFPAKAGAVVSLVDVLLAFATMISAGVVAIACLSAVVFLCRPFARKWHHAD